MIVRFIRFNVAGGLGIGVQLATLSLCLHGLSLHYLTATAIAVTAAVLHNFVWHFRWTWRDRGLSLADAPSALGRFVLANGVVSLVSNLFVMSLLAGAARLPALTANLIAIAAAGLINFALSDRVVFRRAGAGPQETATPGFP
jgi:dolichol-phosphate mannosyltransferase